MWQTIIIWVVIALCAFYIGRLFYKRFRSALSADADGSCAASDCCGCAASSSCNSGPHELHPRRGDDTK